MRWLIKLRWLAIAGVLLSILVGIPILGLPLFWQGILGVAIGLVVLNLVYWLILRERLEDHEDRPAAIISAIFFTHIQIVLDLVLLTLLLYFAGGALNPFIFFYIFHIIIASIVLRRRDSFLQAGWALILFSILVFLTSSERVPHFHLYREFEPEKLMQWDRILIMIGAFAVTVFVAAFLSSSIMERLRQRERELADAYEEVSKREKIKSDFARTVAHELRSPMSAIMNFIYAVRLSEKDKISDKATEYLDRALKRGQGLVDLIRDLLDLSRLEDTGIAERRRLEDVDLIKEIELIIGVEKKSDWAKGVAVNFSHPPSLPALLYSRAAIQQIFSNLISNAFRYTPEEGAVQVEVSREDHRIKCVVSDTGIGITEEARKRVFDEFYRAPDAKQFSPAGTGLGLSITKALVTQYGGEINLESEAGKGTTFTIYFDL